MRGPQRRIVLTAAEESGLALPDEAMDRLGAFVGVLTEWSHAVRLVADADEDTIVSRHVVDSLAVLPLLWPSGAVADIGSGAGFPGIVLACVRPDLDVILIEARRKRANFLRDVARRVPLPRVVVQEQRAEQLGGVPGRTIRTTVSRAVAVGPFLSASARILEPGGRAIAMQARNQRERTFDVEHTARTLGFSRAEPVIYRLPDGRVRELAIFEHRGAVSPQDGL